MIGREPDFSVSFDLLVSFPVRPWVVKVISCQLP